MADVGPGPRVSVAIVDGPLPEADAWQPAAGGAIITFEGVVRPREDGRNLAALWYEDYEPMTRQELEKLADEVFDARALLGLRLEHSRGRVPVGGCSFRLRIASEHRQAALVATAELIDRMKQHVPLWKRPEWLDADPADEVESEPCRTR